MAPQKGYKHSPEARAKMTRAKRIVSPETRAKLSAARSGRKHSPETKAKMRAVWTLERRAERAAGCRAAHAAGRYPTDSPAYWTLERKAESRARLLAAWAAGKMPERIVALCPDCGREIAHGHDWRGDAGARCAECRREDWVRLEVERKAAIRERTRLMAEIIDREAQQRGELTIAEGKSLLDYPNRSGRTCLLQATALLEQQHRGRWIKRPNAGKRGAPFRIWVAAGSAADMAAEPVAPPTGPWRSPEPVAAIRQRCANARAAKAAKRAAKAA